MYKNLNLLDWQRVLLFCFAAGMISGVSMLITRPVVAQPAENYVDPLEREMDDLFEKLRKEGDPSIPKNRDSLRQMNPKEFDEFQRKFLERFFDEGEMSPDDETHSDDRHPRGALARNALQVRNRQVGAYERQTEEELNAYRPAVQTARLSTVAIMNGGKQIALGTVVDSRGSIMTKLSELGDAETVSCQFANGQSFDADVQSRNEDYDLALLFIGGVTTVPVQWAQSSSELGTTVITANQTGMPLNVGTVSVLPRSLVGSNLAFLGVGPGPHESGVEVLTVERDTAAERAGLQQGDIIQTLSDVRTSTVSSLVNAIRSHSPGTKVIIDYLRGSERRSTEAVLDSASMPGDRELRMRLMNRMGAVPSKRYSEFPSALQHDSPLLPEHCGGPLVNLDGKAIGINIARGGRVESYAIPADRVQQLLKQMKATQN